MNQQIKPTFTGDWDQWLEEFEKNLKERGYKKYRQDFRGSDFQYWKAFPSSKNHKYQVGVLFFDFRRYRDGENITVQYYCMTSGDDSIDLIISKNIDLSEFEEMARVFYESMKPYIGGETK